MKIKTCYDCMQTRPINQFSPNSDSSDGYRNQCKNCRNKWEVANMKNVSFKPDLTILEKICGKCKNTKLVEAFNKDIKKPTGYSNRCRECHNVARRKK